MSNLSIGYYPGCSGLGTSLEYDISTRAICRALNIDLVDIPDWSCCGSTPAHTIDHVLSGALAARNFAVAEDAGINDVITPCPSCLKNLRNALENMQDPFFNARVEALTHRPLKKEHSIRSVLQVLVEDIGLETIANRVIRPLKGLKVVPYYGCLMSRPEKIMRFDNPENPMALDNILTALGAEVLPFPMKVECCGASFGIPRRDVVTRLSGKLLDMAASLGAEMVVVACPLCQMNLDLRQGQINSANNTHYTLPVPYFTQLMGYAFGMDVTGLGFDKLNVDIVPVLQNMQNRMAEEERAAKSKEAAKEASAPSAKAEAKEPQKSAAGSVEAGDKA